MYSETPAAIAFTPAAASGDEHPDQGESWNMYDLAVTKQALTVETI